MDVRDAVASRYSCRAFLPTPVPLAVVRDILDRAARAPSGGNLQPWRVDALTGAPLEELKALIRPRHGELPKGEGAEYQIYPSPLKEPYYARRFEVGALLYRALGIPREDRPARLAQYARNFEMFGAPVGLFVSLDRTMGPPQWSDLGGFVQTVLLLARAHGLHSCAQEAWTHWHKTVPPFLGLPDDHILFCGIGLGYADEQAAINGWRAPRAGVGAFATFRGFAEQAMPQS
jgi:nitroreductase